MEKRVSSYLLPPYQLPHICRSTGPTILHATRQLVSTADSKNQRQYPLREDWDNHRNITPAHLRMLATSVRTFKSQLVQSLYKFTP